MKRFGLAALAALAFFAGPAHAAQSGDARPPAPSSAQDLRNVHDFSRCIAQAHPRRARELLAMDFREETYDRAIRQLASLDPRCTAMLTNGQGAASVRARMNSRLFAGRMAEALLLADLGDGALAPRIALDPARPAIEARNEEELTALCVVRAAPAETAAIFATLPASAEEAAAIRAVVPHLSACLTAGATGEFNRPAIRSMLALAAFRLAQHNAAAAAPGN